MLGEYLVIVLTCVRQEYSSSLLGYKVSKDPEDQKKKGSSNVFKNG